MTGFPLFAGIFMLCTFAFVMGFGIGKADGRMSARLKDHQRQVDRMQERHWDMGDGYYE